MRVEAWACAKALAMALVKVVEKGDLLVSVMASLKAIWSGLHYGTRRYKEIIFFVYKIKTNYEGGKYVPGIVA